MKIYEAICRKQELLLFIEYFRSNDPLKMKKVDFPMRFCTLFTSKIDIFMKLYTNVKQFKMICRMQYP